MTLMFSDERKISRTKPLKEEFIIDSLGDIGKEFDYMKYHSFQQRKLKAEGKMCFVIVASQGWKTLWSMSGSWTLRRNRLSGGNYYPDKHFPSRILLFQDSVLTSLLHN